VRSKSWEETGNVPCLILAGGLGTRLGSMLGDIPKAMAPVGGRPFLEYLLRWVRGAGLRQIVLCVGYRAEQIVKYFDSGETLGLEITYSRENEPLGTWGAIQLAGKYINGPNFVVINGDSWLELDLRRFLEFHRQKKGVASVAAVEVENGARFGSMELDASERVTRFVEKRAQGSALINGGVYVFSKSVFEIAGSIVVGSLEKEIFPALIPKGVYGMQVKGYFIDIGVPEAYRSVLHNAKGWTRALESQTAAEGKC
jgi:D-glycero-alpha-D-manno-heptose 1-phosphate guanylyltransferase